MPTIHFEFGGSTAERTLACPHWRKATNALPKINRTSAAADRGTSMHDILFEQALLTGRSVGQVLQEVKHAFDDHDIQQLLSAEAMVAQVFEQYGVKEFACEILMSVADDVGGSCDLIAFGEAWCIVLDAKFGRIPVPAEGNKQLLFYHWLATQSPEVQDMTRGRKLVGAIVQPAVSAAPDIYEFSQAEVDAFAPSMLAAIHAARQGGEPRAGSHCSFCPNEPYCSARRKQVHQTRLLNLDQADSLAAALAMVPQLKAFITAAENEAHTLMVEKGVQLPGFKLVAKKELRKWADPTATAQALTAAGAKDIYTAPELRSPAQIEKVVKAAKLDFDLASHLKPASGELEVAPVTDKREEVKKDVAAVRVSDILANSRSR